VAAAVLLVACGGSDEGSTTRPPITTTLAPASTAAPITTEPPTSSTTTTTSTAAPPQASTSATPTTTIPESLPDSVGTANDPAVSAVPDGAQRLFYAGEDLEESVRENVLGDAQVLYYDVYRPTGASNGLTALYVHGGAIDSGYANSAESATACRQLSRLGAWCIAIEYRRGFAGFPTAPTEATAITPVRAERYGRAYEDARNDTVEAWFHADSNAESLGFPRRYVLVGLGAGAQIVSDVALATPGLPYDIAGAVISSGTHRTARPIVRVPGFPVVLQSGLFDTVAPPYGGRLYLDDDMPTLIGARTLFNQLAAANADVKLYLNAQQGHGPGVYGGAPGEITYYADAMNLFATESGEPTAVIEYRFTCADANFGAAGRGVRISTAEIDGFRYEPYESDMETGLTPAESLVLHPLDVSDCEAEPPGRPLNG